MTSALEVKGLKEIQRALFSYNETMGVKIIRSSLRQGANLVKKQAQINAPLGKTGTLRKGITVKQSKIHSTRDGLTFGVYITLRSGKGRKDPKDPFYGRWIEDGWNVRGKGGGSRSAITSTFGGRSGRKSQRGNKNIGGKKFIDRAFRSARGNALRLIIRTSQAGSESVKRRLGLK